MLVTNYLKYLLRFYLFVSSKQFNLMIRKIVRITEYFMYCRFRWIKILKLSFNMEYIVEKTIF